MDKLKDALGYIRANREDAAIIGRGVYEGVSTAVPSILGSFNPFDRKKEKEPEQTLEDHLQDIDDLAEEVVRRNTEGRQIAEEEAKALLKGIENSTAQSSLSRKRTSEREDTEAYLSDLKAKDKGLPTKSRIKPKKLNLTLISNETQIVESSFQVLDSGLRNLAKINRLGFSAWSNQLITHQSLITYGAGIRSYNMSQTIKLVNNVARSMNKSSLFDLNNKRTIDSFLQSNLSTEFYLEKIVELYNKENGPLKPIRNFIKNPLRSLAKGAIVSTIKKLDTKDMFGKTNDFVKTLPGLILDQASSGKFNPVKDKYLKLLYKVPIYGQVLKETNVDELIKGTFFEGKNLDEFLQPNNLANTVAKTTRVAFDAQTHTSLNVVIPGYLGDIYEALSGVSLVHDYFSGTWKTKEQVLAEEKDLQKDILSKRDGKLNRLIREATINFISPDIPEEEQEATERTWKFWKKFKKSKDEKGKKKETANPISDEELEKFGKLRNSVLRSLAFDLDGIDISDPEAVLALKEKEEYKNLPKRDEIFQSIIDGIKEDPKIYEADGRLNRMVLKRNREDLVKGTTLERVFSKSSVASAILGGVGSSDPSWTGGDQTVVTLTTISTTATEILGLLQGRLNGSGRPRPTDPSPSTPSGSPTKGTTSPVPEIPINQGTTSTSASTAIQGELITGDLPRTRNIKDVTPLQSNVSTASVSDVQVSGSQSSQLGLSSSIESLVAEPLNKYNETLETVDAVTDIVEKLDPDTASKIRGITGKMQPSAIKDAFTKTKFGTNLLKEGSAFNNLTQRISGLAAKGKAIPSSILTKVMAKGSSLMKSSSFLTKVGGTALGKTAVRVGSKAGVRLMGLAGGPVGWAITAATTIPTLIEMAKNPEAVLKHPFQSIGALIGITDVPKSDAEANSAAALGMSSALPTSAGNLEDSSGGGLGALLGGAAILALPLALTLGSSMLGLGGMFKRYTVPGMLDSVDPQTSKTLINSAKYYSRNEGELARHVFDSTAIGSLYNIATGSSKVGSRLGKKLANLFGAFSGGVSNGGTVTITTTPSSDTSTAMVAANSSTSLQEYSGTTSSVTGGSSTSTSSGSSTGGSLNTGSSGGGTVTRSSGSSSSTAIITSSKDSDLSGVIGTPALEQSTIVKPSATDLNDLVAGVTPPTGGSTANGQAGTGVTSVFTPGTTITTTNIVNNYYGSAAENSSLPQGKTSNKLLAARDILTLTDSLGADILTTGNLFTDILSRLEDHLEDQTTSNDLSSTRVDILSSLATMSAVF